MSARDKELSDQLDNDIMYAGAKMRSETCELVMREAEDPDLRKKAAATLAKDHFDLGIAFMNVSAREMVKDYDGAARGYGQAVKEFSESIRLAPKDPMAHLSRANATRHQAGLTRENANREKMLRAAMDDVNTGESLLREMGRPDKDFRKFQVQFREARAAIEDALKIP